MLFPRTSQQTVPIPWKSFIFAHVDTLGREAWIRQTVETAILVDMYSDLCIFPKTRRSLGIGGYCGQPDCLYKIICNLVWFHCNKVSKSGQVGYSPLHILIKRERERERERERQRQRQRQRHRERDRQTDRQTETETDRDGETEAEKVDKRGRRKKGAITRRKTPQRRTAMASLKGHNVGSP